MAAPVVDAITFNGVDVQVFAHGGNGGLHPIVDANRGTLTRVGGSTLSRRGMQTLPWRWTWQDNWTGTHEAPPLYITAEVLDSDLRGDAMYASFPLASTAFPLTAAPAPRGVGPSSTVSTASWLTGVATFTTTAAHGLSSGDAVTVTGVSPAGYNVTTLGCTVTSTTQFTVPINTNPTAYVSGGSITSFLDDLANLTGLFTTGHMVQLSAGGTYYVSNAIVTGPTLESNALVDIGLDYNGATVNFTGWQVGVGGGTGTHGGPWHFQHCHAVVIKNGTSNGNWISGKQDETGGGNGISYPVQFWSVTDGWVTNMAFANCIGEGVYVSQYGETPGETWSSRVTIDGGTTLLGRNDRQGLALSGSTDGYWVVGVPIKNCRFNIFDLEMNQSSQIIQRVRLLGIQAGVVDSGFYIGMGAPGTYKDILSIGATRYGTDFQPLNVAPNGSGAKSKIHIHKSVSTSQSLSPNGLYNNCQKVTDFLVQSCQQSYRVTAKAVVQLHTNSGQVRIYNNVFTGAIGGIYSDDGTGSDIIEADNTTP